MNSSNRTCEKEKAGNGGPSPLIPEFSDYVIYADESGNHGLTNIDPDFPVFALVFCIVRKDEYTNTIAPAIHNLKFRHWGHDSIILHENEIRKEKREFAYLRASQDLRRELMEDLAQVLRDAPISIIAAVVEKVRLTELHTTVQNPYYLALRFCMNQLLDFLIAHNQENKTVHVLFESRWSKEDRVLGLEFIRICAQRQDKDVLGKPRDFTRVEFVPRFVKKAANLPGLQLADLTARPIATSVIRPHQSNRAYEIIKPKLLARGVLP